MAEVTGMRNNALPYPIYAEQFTVTFPMLDADGDLVTGATTPDAEVSKNGDTFADCTNESTEIATNSGVYYLTLTAAEMTADIVTVIAKSATAGMKTTVITLYPRKLVKIRTGTCNDDGSGTADVVLDASAKAVDDYYNGMVVCVVIDGAASAECRVITDYTGSTQTATVATGFNTAVDNTDTFTIYIPEGAQHGDSLYGDKIYSDTTYMEPVVSDIQSDTNVTITKLTEADTSDILSLVTIVNSRVLVIKSDTSDIVSNLAVADCSDVLSRLTVITSEGDISDILSRLTVTNSQLLIVKSDTSDIRSELVVLDDRTKGLIPWNGTIGGTGNSTTAVHIPDLTSYADDTLNGYLLVIKDVSATEWHVRVIKDWETTGNTVTVDTLPFTPQNSTDLYWIISAESANSVGVDLSDIQSLLTLVRSDTAVIETVTSDIQSDTNKLVSDASEADASDIISLLTKVYSDTTHIDSDVTALETIVSDVQSDTNKLVSDATEADASDILSRLTITNSQLLIVKSDTSDILSRLTVHDGIISDIQSDTNVIITKLGEADTSDILSRLTVLDTRLKGVVLFNGTIGGTGNSTTVVHLPDLGSYGDDELNNYMLVIFDVSESEYHVRTIADWETTGNTATVATLPFTPQDSTDTYWLLSEQPTSISGGPLTSDQDSKLSRIANAIVEVDTSDIQSLLTIVNSRVLVIKSDTSDIVSNLAVADSSDVLSRLTVLTSEGDFSDVLSRLTVTNSQLVVVKSDAAHIESQTTRIHSDTITLASDLAEGDFSDILSRLTVTNSQLLIVKSDTSDIRSALVIIASDIVSHAAIISDIQSDTNKLVSDATEVDTSDILSMLTIVRDNVSDIQSDTNVIITKLGEGDTSDILSRLTVTNSQLLIVKSDTSDIRSALVIIASDAAHIESDAVRVLSDTTHIDSDTTHIESDAARIDSATTVIKSELLVVKSDTSDITSSLVKVYSDTTLISGKTGSLTFTQAGVVDANIQYVNDVQVNGTGTTGDEWGP